MADIGPKPLAKPASSQRGLEGNDKIHSVIRAFPRPIDILSLAAWLSRPANDSICSFVRAVRRPMDTLTQGPAIWRSRKLPSTNR